MTPINPYSSNLYPNFNDPQPADDLPKAEKDPYDLDLEIQNPANQPALREQTLPSTQQCNTPICSQICTQTCNGGPGCP